MVTRVTLRRNSVTRFGVDAAGVIFGAAGAVITTRILGPSGQGVFAALFFISNLMITIAGLGLGDAAVVWVGQAKASYRLAAGATLAAVLITGTIALLVTVCVAAALVEPRTASLWLAVIATAVDVPVSVLALSCGSLLNVHERIRASSAIALTLSGVTFLGLIAFVWIGRLGVFGAVLAGVIASDVALLNALRLLRRADLVVRPQWDNRYLRGIVGFAARLQVVSLLTIAANRLDVILVFALAGRAAAGRYSVPLTIGGIATMVPYSMSYASFPRLANLEPAEADHLTSRTFRVGITAALATAAVLAAAAPVAVPLLLGARYERSVLPAEILLVGGVFISGQWVLARAAAARGNASVLMRSFGISVVVMVVLDLGAIPAFGIVGAATSSSLSSLAAFVYCVGAYRAAGNSGQALWPRRATVREFSDAVRSATVRTGTTARADQASPLHNAADSTPSESTVA